MNSWESFTRIFFPLIQIIVFTEECGSLGTQQQTWRKYKAVFFFPLKTYHHVAYYSHLSCIPSILNLGYITAVSKSFCLLFYSSFLHNQNSIKGELSKGKG